MAVLLVFAGMLLFADSALAQTFSITKGADKADLSVDKEAIPNPVAEGDLLIYTITVINDGPDTAQGVIVTDDLPNGVRFLGADPSQGQCDENDNIVTCDLRDLEYGEEAEIAIFVQPNVTGPIENFAEVESTTEDPDEANNDITLTTRVNREGRRDDPRRDDRRFPDFFPPFFPDGPFDPDRDNDGIIDTIDEDIDDDGDVDQDDDLSDAENDLFDAEDTDGELTDGDDFDDDGPGVSATADDGQAEASTPGAVASAGGDPDESPPLRSAPDNVVDEIPTSGPLPNTGGMPLIYWLLPLAGLLILAGLPVYRWAKRR
ncbi:MAG TPA: DUF11 domain-containing protein [Rubrobacteraceae bacterium]|nr:DUF11 domain-containing protein [Rubrobacteraceae bacterium]